MTNIIKKFKTHLIIFASVLGVFLFLTVALLITHYQLVDKVLPRTYASNISLDFKTKEEVQKILNSQIKEYLATPLIFEFKNEKYAISPHKINLEFNLEETLKNIGFGGKELNFIDLIKNISTVKNFNIDYTYDKDLLLLTIREHIPFFQNDPVNAKFKLDKDEIFITEAKDGFEVNKDELFNNLENNLKNLQKQEIFLSEVVAKPQVEKSMLEANKETLLSLLNSTIDLNYNSHSWKFIPKENLDLVNFKTGNALSEKTSQELEFAIDYDALKNLLELNGAKQTIEVYPGKVKISRDKYENITFEGQAGFGKEINFAETASNIASALNSENTNAEIAIDKIPSELEISEDLQKLGITDLLATGYSTYYGSPANRTHNISVGLSKYNGVLIAPGETFSFNKELGAVDASTGYLPELVITAGGTLPEYGGGLCQVSTTVYRGVLEAGLPIVERSPHSYAVSYYAQVDGHGLDSTIYPGVKDLKFTNDTPGYLLIQTSVVNTYEAYVNIYGTSDGRETWLEGPFIGDYRYPGPTQTITTNTLAPGEQKWVEKSHVGFDANWVRYIKRADGSVEKQDLLTTYQAIPAKVMVGASQTSETESAE